jgi:hypothetical protein
VRAYSFRQIPNCGKCHKPLPEHTFVVGLRDLYRSRVLIAFLAIVAVPLVGFTAHSLIAQQSAATPAAAIIPIDACANRPQPREGVYGWYGPLWGQDIAELTIKTPAGSNYFVKLVDLNGRTARSYFIHGGLTETFSVPLGTFVLKYAMGHAWCDENDLFGESTVTQKAADTFTFDSDTHWTVELILQRHGNLDTRLIPRSDF